MRKWVVMALIGALALIPAAAFADVDIDVDIHKDKTKIVKEKLFKFKAAVILVLVLKVTDKAAESETLVNQTNTGNFQLDFSPLFGSNQSTGTVEGNSGITGVNLSSGNMNNQANAVSVAADGGNDHSRLFFGGSFAESQAATDQKNERNKLVTSLMDYVSTLTVSKNSGITGVNQSSGHMNNQANAVSVAVGVDPAVSLSEADLGQVNAWNKVINFFDSSSKATATVSGNSGITGVNQSSGHMNNQSNVVSVAATR